MEFRQENTLRIRLSGSDGYSIEVPAEILANRDIILAYLVNGKSLDERKQPLRAIILEERAVYWVRTLIN